MAEISIYQKLLGADFEQLSPALQVVHGRETPVHARGQVSVTYGRGPLVRLCNRMMHVPPASENVMLKLKIQRSGAQETWIRDFGGKPLATQQWAENGLFIEAVGGVEMAMRLRVSDGILRFEPAFTRFKGMKIPRFIGVTVYAEVRGHENGWQILVETRSPILGLLFRYTGLIKLES